MLNILKGVLFGIVEGVTEWLPISSTAHMKILNKILPLSVSAEFYEMFEVVIQLGAIIALLIIFWNKVWPFGYSKNALVDHGPLRIIKKDKFFLWLKIAIACIPVILYELLLEDIVTIVNADNELTIIACSLIVIGVIFVVVEFALRHKLPDVYSTKDITFLSAAIIGLCQLVAAIFPGVSRSGATIIAGLLMGICRQTAVEFTFELSIPVMFGASLMRVIKFAGEIKLLEVLTLLVGCASAFVVSLFMIRFVLNYIKNHTFTLFGLYRIIFGIIILLLI